MRKITLSVVPALALAACGGDDGASLPIDAPGGTIDAPPAACTISTTSFGDKGALTGVATFAASTMNPALYRIALQAALEGAEPTDVLFIDFFTGYEPFGTQQAPTAVMPGTYNLAGAQTDFATCGVCVTMGTNATMTGYEDDYMVTGGTVNLTALGDAVGETLTLSVSGLQLQHVNIDPQTGATTSANDGCTTTLANATFTGMVMAPSVAAGPAQVPGRPSKTRY
jgi:hypothetical protein